MSKIDFDVLDYIEDIDTWELCHELQSRNDSAESKLSIIRSLLGLREWHDKDRIIQEIEQL